MAVFSYVGGSVSMATGGYGNIAIRKGAQVAVPNTITTSARSFIEGTPASGLFDPVDRGLFYSRISHGSGYSATKINFNTTEPYNSGAYSTSSYYTPYNTVFQDLDYSQYNTQSPSGEYWAHAYGYINSEFGTAIAVDRNRNAWVVGSTDYCSSTITSITASLTTVGSFTNSTTTPNSGTNDSGYFSPWALPFNHNIFGLNDTFIVVQSNSWLSFQPLINNTLTAFTATSPGWANIQIGAGEASCQRLYWGTFGIVGNRTFRIRFEGTNATTGTLGSPNMVWEFILYESNPNIFDIQIGAWTPPATNANGITDGTTYFGTFTPTANTGWRFNTGNVTSGASGNNITLVKYSNKGRFHQNKDFFPYTENDDLIVVSIGRNGSDVGEAIKIGSDGRIYILYTSNSQGYVLGVTNNDLGIIKIDPDYLYKTSNAVNAVVWNKTFGTTFNDSAQSFDIDANDNLYITGFTVGSGQGSNDIIVIKVDKTGTVVWKKTYGGSTGGELGNAIKISPDGNLYVWGISSSSPLINATADFYLLKINGTTGAIIWQKHFNIGASTNATVFENSVDVDSDGNVYVNGFGAASPQSYFVAKLDSSGNFKWSRNVGALTGNPDAGTTIKYKNGFVYVAGQDTSTFNNSESYGLGVSKLDANTGQLISNYVVGGVSTEYAFAIDVDAYNDIYATGVTNTSLPGLTSAGGVNAFTTKFILDTPQGGFTVSGDAGVWSSTTAKRYTTSRQAFTAEDIAFQNDLIATGQQFIFVGTTSETQVKFEKEFAFTGSGSLPALTSTNVNTLLTFDSPETTPSIQLFTLSGTSTITYKNALNKPVQIYTGSSDLSLLNGYEVVFDPDLYTGKFQYKVYDSNLYSTEKFEKEFRFTGSGSISSSGINVIADVTFKGGVGAAGIQLFTIGSGYTSVKATRSYLKSTSNLLSTPQDFNTWVKLNSVTISTDVVTAPDGTLTADKFIENTLSGGPTSHKVIAKGVTLIPSTNYTVSIFVKAAERTTILIHLRKSDYNTRFGGFFNLSTQTFTSEVADGATLTNYSVIPYPDNWYRISISGDIGANTAGVITLYLANSSNNIEYLGDGTSGIYVWGSKLESSSIATPYIADSGVTLYDNFINISGTAITRAPNRHIGASPIEYYNPSQVVFEDGENFRASEFKADARAFYRFQKGAFSASGSIGSEDTAFKSTTNVAFIPLNTILIFNTNAFTKLAMRYAGKSPTTPFGGLEIVFEELEANAPPQQFKYSGAASEPIRAFRWVATPSAITITGTAVEKNTEAYAVSGQLTTGLQASAKVTFRPFDATDSEQLFSINGQHGTRVFVPNWSASGSIQITGTITPPPEVNSWIGSSPIQYFDPYEVVFEDGENFRASEFKYDSTALYRFQKGTFSGTGSITADPNASATVVFNPPDEAAGVQLFNVTGTYSDLKFVKKSSEASGNISITGTLTPPPEVNSWVGSSPIQYFDPDDIVFGEGENFRASEFKYDSTALYRFQKGTLSGTGSIATDPNASAAVVFNPPDTAAGIQLFNVTGQHGTRVFVPNWRSTGSLSTGFEGSVKVTFNPPEFDPLFTITGSLVERSTKGLYTGNGSINSSDFGSARVTFRPFDATDSDPLFSINGQHGTKVFVPNWIATGLSTVSGNGSYRRTSPWIGSSPIQYFDPYEVVFEDQENFRASEFKYDSTALYRFQNANFNASGSITTDPNASAKVTFNPPDTAAGIQLFNVTGVYSDLRSIKKVLLDASPLVVTISGAASDEKHIDVATGSGSTSITGTLVEKQTEVAIGSGTLLIDGSAVVIYKAGPFATSGGITISGDATNIKFISQAGEAPILFQISGASAQPLVRYAWVGSSPIQYFDPYEVVFEDQENFRASEFKYDSTALYRFQNATFSGTGSIATDPNASAKVTFNPPDTAAGIQLFNVTGAYSDLRFTNRNTGSGFITFSGSSIESQTESISVSGLITFSGTVVEKQIDSVTSSGSIFAISGASESIGVNPVDTTQLFTVSGQHGTRVFVPAWRGAGNTALSGSGSQSIQYGNFTGNSPSAYIDPYKIVFGEEENYGSTEIALSGYSRFSATPRGEVGSGALFTAGFFSNLKASFRPFDATDSEQLFSINGQHGTRVFVPNWRSTGSLSTGFEGSVKVTFNPPEFDPLFTTSGAAVDKHIDVASGSGNLFTASGGAPKVTFRPVDATDTDFLFSITGAAGVKLRDYVWVSAVVEYDPYEYVINDEFIIPDFIKLKGTFVWDNVNNIYRSLTTESITRDITSGFAGSSLVSQDIQGFLGATAPSGISLDIPLETVSGTGSGATVSYLASTNQIVFIEILSGGNGYTSGSVLRLPVGSNPTIVLGNIFNAPAISAAIIQGNVGTRTFVPNWRGSGFISITGNVIDKHIDDATGSGNLFAASGASQSIGVNPPDDIALFVVSGTAVEKHIDRTSGSGSTTFSGTAVEKQTEVASGSGEAAFGGGSVSIQIINYNAFGGVISFSNTATAAVTFNPPEADPLFLISGSATDSQTDITSGSGSIATDISAVSRVVFNPADTEQLFEVTGTYSNLKFTSDYSGTGSVDITGTVVEQHIDAASGSGSSTITGAATESQTDIAVSETGTIIIDGASEDLYIKGAEQFGGTLFIIEGGAERVAFNPPEGNQLFDVSGSFSDIKITSDYVGTGSITIEGNVGSRVFVPNWIGSGTIAVTGESTQKHINITSGSGALSTDGFYSDLKATFRSVSDVGLFDITGNAVEKQVEVAIASGSITFTGSATDSETDVESGSGSIVSGFNASASVTFNPSEDTALFNITGFVSQKQTSKESGSGSVALTGTLVEKHIDAVTGSGSIAAGFNASASVTFRPFDATDTDALFTILGSAIEKNTESYVGSGDATFSGTAADSQRNITSGSGALFADGFFSDLKATFRPFDATDLDPLFFINGSATEKNTESYVGSGTATFAGTAVEKQIEVASGSGTLFSASGAAEAFSVNALEDVALFDISGAASLRYFARNIGSGSITTGFEGTASVTFNPPEFDPLFNVSGSYSNLKFISANVVSGTATFSGTVVEKFTTDETGSGTATFSGTVVEKQTDITSGSGSLFTASGSAEAFVVNPPEGNQLFAVSGTYSDLKFISANNVSGTATFSGTVVEKQIEVATGSGTATFSGTVVEKQTDITSGSGSLFTASGSAEAFVVNPPDDIALFNISGTYSNFKFTSAWIGTGTLFAVSGAAQSVTFNPPEDTQLFVVTGSVTQSQTNIAAGSGSLFTAFGGTASVTFNPPEGNQLFDVSGTYSDLKFISANNVSGTATFSGTVVEKFTTDETGSGIATFSGTVVEKQTDITSSSGSLFTASGSAEAFVVNPEDTTVLYDITGDSDLKSTNAYVGSGSLFTFSGAVVVVSISEIGTGLFDITDTSTESTTYKTIDVTGSLFGFAGGVESVTFNPVENTQLFQVSGEVYATTSFGYGGGTLDINGSGQATFRRALVPQVGSGEILSSGESSNKKTFAPFVGSGSLFSASGSAQATTNVPPIDSFIWEDDLRTTLYLASGSASVSRTASIDNDVTINIGGSIIVRTALPERIFVTII